VAPRVEGALAEIRPVLDVSGVVRAAGGVIVRPDADGIVRIAVVHRPRYDDWTLPKGKLLDGEADEEAARREVLEETGIRCELEDELPTVRYVDRRGRRKRVRYWTMRPLDGSFEPNDEVDEVRWPTIGEALDLLSYERDRRMLRTIPHRS
jgi:8-oxo-dGTP pyrophosphatase MutT (NUDIX family)